MIIEWTEKLTILIDEGLNSGLTVCEILGSFEAVKYKLMQKTVERASQLQKESEKMNKSRFPRTEWKGERN